LLAVIALLLVAVLCGSFLWIFADLRARYASDLQTSIESSVAAFRAGEDQRFRTLEVMAGSLESSPSFRNVLRQTDRATLVDFLESSRKGLQVDLLIVCDDQGRLQASAPRIASQSYPSGPELTGWAASTAALRHYWWLDGHLYQGGTVPLVDSQDYIEGYLSVAYRLDQSMLRRLAQELDSRMELRGGEQVLSSELGPATGYLWRSVDLGTPARAQLWLGRSMDPFEAVVSASRLKLVSLGAAALVLALMVSYPLVGKIANPLEELQRAEAEMAAIFQASLDGLISCDHNGRVCTANPAAAVALGVDIDSLKGSALFDLLPESVLGQLALAPEGVQQQADFERAGHLFKVFRSFVRPRGSVHLGSILLFHDVTEERHRERKVSYFLKNLCRKLEIPQAPWRVRVGLAALKVWSEVECLDSGDELCPIARCLGSWIEEFRPALPPSRECRLQILADESELVALAEPRVRLLVELLLDNALEHGQGRIDVSLAQVGGTLELLVDDQGAQGVPEASPLDAAGLGLTVARAICVAAQGRLEVGPAPTAGTRCLVVLPRGLR
jgi:PAS domain S-box-containing protein